MGKGPSCITSPLELPVALQEREVFLDAEAPDAPPYTPEQRLWYAVLVSAIHEAQRRDGPIRDAARAWLARDDATVRSFRWVCEWCRVDAEYLRRGLIHRGLVPRPFRRARVL